jgi:hypothetical protein
MNRFVIFLGIVFLNILSISAYTNISSCQVIDETDLIDGSRELSLNQIF